MTWLPTAYYLVTTTTHYPLIPTTYYLLPTTYYLLPTTTHYPGWDGMGWGKGDLIWSTPRLLPLRIATSTAAGATTAAATATSTAAVVVIVVVHIVRLIEAVN